MNKYYYTFGTDENFPYYCGHVEIYAESWEKAHEKFRTRFPDRHKNTLNCAFYYDEKEWEKNHMLSNPLIWLDDICHEVIE